MECRDKSAAPTRKLIQARLPFKRLNPIPKEKLGVSPGIKKAKNSQNVLDQNSPCPALSHLLPDNVENTCQVETETQLVNGKGPLDNFVQKSTKNNTSQLLLIDLTEDSNHRLSDNIDHSKSNKVAASVENTHKEVETEPGPQKSICNTHVDVLMTAFPATADEGELSNMVSTQIETDSPKGSKLKNVIFERKMPVVVLEDIMMAKSPQGAPLERSLSSGNETIESCSEDDKECTDSSLSSASLTSSPESVPTQGCKDNVSPIAASTPVGKTSQKIHQSSEEKEKLKLQRDQERADKLQKLQAKREEKGRLKEEAKATKERAREEAKRKREEERELKDKERKEKKEKDEREKAEKLRVKEEKRKEKQEALEAKQEEKRKKEEEKRLKEEEKRIKAEKAEITRFFQKPKTQPAPKTLAGWCGKFAPFEIKENMFLAPLCRVAVDQDLLDRLDCLLQGQSYDASFLGELKSRAPCTTGPALTCSHGADVVNSDVVIVGSSQAGDVPERKKFGRQKLLQFCENHRPAYWGTWNRESSAIRPRNPWSKDEKLLDYEVESDEEWEEEEPGESLSHSEGDDDDDGAEEEEEDDGFFVPHGYLSEDEGVTEECDPENHKARQKLKAKEWDELITKGKRFRVLQLTKIGCVWEGNENGHGTDGELRFLQQFAASILDSTIADEDQIEKSNKKKMKDRQILGQLLPLLHGNVNGSKVIIQEFQECCRMGLLLGGNSSVSAVESVDMSPASPKASWAQTPAHDGSTVPSKARLKQIISENSVYEKRPDHRMCWYVQPEVLKSYGQENLPVPCQWSYVTQVTSVAKEDAGNGPGGVAAQTTPVSAKRKSTGSMSITKFMKRPQVEATETDGFQADTEEEDDDDCVIMDMEQSKAPALRTPEPPSEMDQAAAVNSSHAV
ncbi:chromatin assembly factor 1 subunit A [Rhineura floridana]|uniref:chromatin assembly factor 1 subunit A n=1 Tax=Rhineura floridana TaxID=261503 RepID=UPI002AC7F8A7|nr:chromatin assembly factor 1 subunit A [Rhineura floridana]XP_061457503.1 chromatin assembly factor 1 subunit A [Rhineura floridana]XP_061457504.1 chromatin assembly factor 1 subunit A [Rhineura floridana]